MENTDSDHVHSSPGEVFTHVRVVVVPKVSGSLLVLNLLLIWALTKAHFTDHVGHGQELVGLHPVLETRNLVNVRPNEVAAYQNCQAIQLLSPK